MKYRIKQTGDLYYPQYRFWFIWETFYIRLGPHGGWDSLHFKTLEEARDYLDKKVQQDIYNKSLEIIKYHKYP